MKKKGSKKKIGRANPLLYGFLYSIVKPIFTRKYNIIYDNEIVKKIKGPAVIIATHTSNNDHILSGLTFYPLRPNYVVSDHFLRKPATAMLLRLMHVIPKKMFSTDVSTVVNMMRAKDEGSVLVIFPEGRLSCYGKTLPLAAGTAELIKKLGVDLYGWKAEGAYLTLPKWCDKGGERIGKIKASVKPLLTASEIAEMDVDAIREVAEKAIYNDDELAMAGVEYKSKAIAKGVDKILFKCPKCLADDKITAEGDHIRCECGLDVTLDSTYRLHGAPFERINEWFDWQQREMDTENGSLYSKARLGCCKDDGYMDSEAGEGEIYIDKNCFKLSGVMHGEKIEFSVNTEQIGAFPITPGEHFTVYHGGRLIYVYPQPDPRTTVKWVCFLDNLNAKREHK